MELKATSSRILIAVAKLFILNLLVLPVSTQPGFISIDCGGADYWDPSIHLNWTKDDPYLQAGTELLNEGVTIRATVGLPESATPAKQLNTAMVFYPGKSDRVPRSKFCYKLPVEFNSSGESKNILLRATFPSSNLTTNETDKDGKPISLREYSTRFYFAVDSTYIATIELDEHQSQTIELIITALSTNVYVCLVPLDDRSSMPAISALELRQFADGMYSKSYDKTSAGESSNKQTSYLLTISRFNFGGDPDKPSIRYPEDKYDRIWSSPKIPISQKSQVRRYAKNMTSVPSNDSVYDIYPPVSVLSTAWVGTSLSSNISWEWNLTHQRPQRPMPSFYSNLLFYEQLENDSNTTRNMNSDYDVGKGRETFYHGIELWYEFLVYARKWDVSSEVITMTISWNGTGDLPPMITMAEICGELNAVMARTITDDAEAVEKFSENLKSQLDTAGDPCLPIPWTGIVCSIELPTRVTQINLTSRTIGGPLPRDLGNLTRLTLLDLSNNTFSGGLMSSIGNISSLRALNLGDNKLTGDLPNFRPGSIKTLEFLSIAGNKLSGNIDSLIGAVISPLHHLNLSTNAFSGSIPTNVDGLKTLETLDLSNNQLSGELKFNVSNLSKLKTMNLKNNNLTGMVPDSIWSSPKLESVNLEGNGFTELNLTTWYKSVKAKKSFDATGVSPMVRLVGNKIQRIIPDSITSVEIPEPGSSYEQIVYLLNPVAFILVGNDSVWCQKRPQANRTLVERFLCRNDEHENFWPDPHDRNNGVSEMIIIVVSVICGLLVLFLVCVFGYILRRMSTRNHEFRQFQEDLAKENVKPPIFNYNDLKIATRSFSKDSILGQGGFGTVYKADMPDGTVLAVKRLFPTEQNTSDFFKELVNIMGIKHRHLIQLKGCCLRKKHDRMLVYEYAENRSLAEALWRSDKPFVLSWEQRLKICLGIARGLAYLHEELMPKMVHRDIKPQNILLDKDFNAKIADFGLVRPTVFDTTQVTFNIGGTRGYCSPEYVNEGLVSEKLDVFSFGVVMLEIVSGRVCIDYSLPPDRIFLRTWAMDLYEEGNLLKLVDKELMTQEHPINEDEVLVLLQTALTCCHLDSKKRPIMSQVVTKLMKHGDIAIEIVRELKGHKTALEDIFEEEEEVEEEDFRSLLSANTTRSLEPEIELSAMRPR